MTLAPAPPRAATEHPPSTTVDIGGVALELLHLPGPHTDRAPLVFLHEGLGSVDLWGQKDHYWPATLCAATGRSGWVWSRRGYGRSDPIPDVRGSGRHGPDYMHRAAWDTLPQLLRACGVERPVLVGHSDGATIALLHASRHPVTACVAMAPHVFVEDVALRAIEQAREAYLHTPLRERLARYHRDVDNAFWQWNDVWLSAPFRAFDIRTECAAITAPLLLIQGEDDEYGTMAQLDDTARAVPHAQRLALPGCGHSPHRDQAEAVTRAITDFLAPLA